jgi:hypothetical protein
VAKVIGISCTVAVLVEKSSPTTTTIVTTTVNATPPSIPDKIETKDRRLRFMLGDGS